MQDSTPARPERTIKSYGRTHGRLTESQAHALEQLWPKYNFEILLETGKLDALKDRFTDWIVEIGFGNGDSLLQQAQHNPDSLFIGIEVYLPGIGACLQRIEKMGLSNLFLLNKDAKDVIEHLFPKYNCPLLERVQIFFPDPWPKKRHHKRRLVQTDFINSLLTVLKPNGKIHIATDWEAYAVHCLDVLQTIPTIKNESPNGDYVPRPDYRPLTKFEQRGIKLGHGVWDIIFSNKKSAI